LLIIYTFIIKVKTTVLFLIFSGMIVVLKYKCWKTFVRYSFNKNLKFLINPSKWVFIFLFFNS